MSVDPDWRSQHLGSQPENLDVDFAPPRFNRCLFENEADEETHS